MGSLLKNFIIKYMWSFPLALVLIGILYFMNLFERIDFICPYLDEYSVFNELELAIGIMLFITAILNWALVGYAKYIYSGACEVKKVKTRKNAGK